MTQNQLVGFILGPIATAAVGFISIPVIAWFYSPEDIGRISMLQITVTFSIILFGLGLDQALVREYYDAKDKENLLLNTTLPGLSIILLGVLVVIFMPTLVSEMLFGVKSGLYSSGVVICILLAFVSRNLSLLLRLLEHGVSYSLSQLLPKLIFLVSVLLGIVLISDYSFAYLLLFHTISIAAVTIILLWNTQQKWRAALKTRPDVKQIRYMLGYAAPLVFGSIAYWGLTATDRLLIRNLSTFTELGVYSLAINFAAAATILQSIFGILWTPWVYKKVANGNLSITDVDQVKRYVQLIVILVFCLMGLFSWLIDFILPPQYYEVKYFVVACVGLPLLYILSEVSGIGVGITKRTGFYVLASVTALAANIGLNLLLIPFYGGAGAAVSTCLSLFLYLIIRTETSALVWQAIPRVSMYFFIATCVFLSSIMALKMIQQSIIYYLWLLLLGCALFSFKKDLIALRKLLLQQFNKKEYL